MTENKKNTNYIIGGVALIGVVILIFIILTAYRNYEETSFLIGTWERKENFTNISRFMLYPPNEGVKTKTYIFKKNGKCIENIIEEGTKTYPLTGIEEPFKREVTNYYTYQIDFDKNILKLFDYEFYGEDLQEYNSCIQRDNCDMEKPIKSDYEEQYILIVSEFFIFIDDNKFEKK